MTSSQYISVREAAQILGITEKKVMDLIESEELIAYRIANQFLRLKKTEVTALHNTGNVVNEISEHPYTGQERIADFFYFNDFYIFTTLLILTLLYLIFYT